MYMPKASTATVCPKGMNGLSCASCDGTCSSRSRGMGDFSILGAVAGGIMGGTGRGASGSGGGDTTVITSTNVNTNVSPQISPNFQQSSGSGALVASSSQAPGGPDLSPYLPTPSLPIYGPMAPLSPLAAQAPLTPQTPLTPVTNPDGTVSYVQATPTQGANNTLVLIVGGLLLWALLG